MTGAPPKPSDCQKPLPGAPVIGFSDWLGRIVCGDNSEVLSNFPAECVDLVVTSPPYDDLRTYGGHSWNFETLSAQLVRVLKPGGVIVWVVADATVNGSETLTSMRQAIHFKDVCGLNVHDTMIYAKTAVAPMFPGTKRCNHVWEYALVLSKGSPRAFNPPMERKVDGYKTGAQNIRTKLNGDKVHKMKLSDSPEKLRGNIWWYQVGKGQGDDDAAASDHPAKFPEALAKDHVATWSNPGDVILDPFAGSGTTLKAAKELNRQWCGIDINPEYCAIAEARLSQDVLQLETCAMRPNSTLGHP